MTASAHHTREAVFFLWIADSKNPRGIMRLSGTPFTGMDKL